MEPKGLTKEEGEAKLKEFGLNEIKVKKNSFFKKVVLKTFSPISLMLIAASILSFVINKLFDFYFILALFAINAGVQLWQEDKADKAIEKLSEQLTVKVKVLRDNRWIMVNSKEIVPGDIVQLMVGSLIPADIKIIESKNLSVNEAVLTGESLPKDKNNGELIYSGSFIATGFLIGKVIATGENTSFNKTISLVEKPDKKSILERDILTISKFLMIIGIIAVLILTGVFLVQHQPIGELLILDLSLLIAGIPVALPVVMSLIISIGVLELAKKKVIVRRLSSLEDLSNVNILLTDKTGTLTNNKIIVEGITNYYHYTSKEIMSAVSSIALKNDRDSINQSIISKFKELCPNEESPELLDFIPADSERKRAYSFVKTKYGKIAVSIGAPQVIEKLCKIDSHTLKTFQKDVEIAASKGYRTIAVSFNEKGKAEKNMRLAGILLLSDPPLPEAKEVIKFLNENGIQVKILTGDNKLITERVSNRVGLRGIVVGRNSINFNELDKNKLEKIAAYAEILPKDKYELVKMYEKDYVVAVTGDGVNDLPAIKESNVGIAVSNSADALKSSADIVLLSSGIDVIKDAIIESRKIFERLYTYSLYRLSESFRLIITILVLGLIMGGFPLTPIQLILLAFLNDLPIISLAFNRVKINNKARNINVKARFVLSSLFGSVGVVNSLLMYFIASNILHLGLPLIQTIFFLKFAVGGHLLILVAHTKEKWYKYLPSKEVLIAVILTQLTATTLALTGFLMGSKISVGLVIFVWIWAIFWMQVSDWMKKLQSLFINPE